LSEDRLVEQGADHRRLFAQFGLACAVLGWRSRLADALVAAGWRLRYRDAQWVVLARP
jgi:hypothetical protein